MKKIFKSFLCTLGALAVFSCAVDELNAPSPIEVPDGYTIQKFTALVDTKTEVIDGHTVWSTGDQIKLFWDGGDGVATLDGEGGSATGSFLCAVPDGKTVTCAVYPADAQAVVDGSNISVTFPEEQAGTFAAGNIAVSKVGEGNVLSFYNLNSFLAIQLVSDDVTKIEVESVAAGALVGTLPVNIAGDEPVFGDLESPAASVSMTAGVAGIYYISVLPGIDHDGGLLLKYYKGEEVSGTYMLDKALTTRRSHVLKFGEFEPDYNYYVTVGGAGKHNGLSWENAFSKDEMWALLAPDADSPDEVKAAKLAAVNGATFHLGAGEYALGDIPLLRFDEDNPVKLTFKGDYPAAGGEQDRTGAANRAFFSGEGSHAALILRGKINVTFDGIGFINGYGLDDEEASDDGETLKVSGSLDAVGDGVSITMRYCDVKDNTNVDAAKTGNSGNWGAGIRLKDVAVFNIDSVTFARNTSFAAAALSIRGVPAAVVNNCKFIDNSTTWKGGALFNTSGTNTTVSNCTFEGNSSTTASVSSDTGKINGGGAFTQSSGACSLINCEFINNNAYNIETGDSTIQGCGGAINVTGGDMTIESCSFSGNNAWRGGAIWAKSSGNVIFNNSIFTGNGSETTRGGGVAYLDKAIVFNNCTFGGDTTEEGNKALYGGALEVCGGTGTEVNGGLFKNNYAYDCGGAICQESNFTLGKYNGQPTYFIDNVAVNTGGAIHNEGSGTATFEGAVFYGNHNTSTESGNGGCVRVTGGTAKFNSCTFGGTADGEANYSVMDGGAMSLNGGTTTITDCEYIGNYAFNDDASRTDPDKGYGGAIDCYSGAKMTINGATFSGNVAWRGGAINLSASNNVTISDATFIGNGNQNTRDGGAVLIGGSKTYTFNDCIAKGNRGAYGGFVYCKSSGTTKINRGTFGGDNESDANVAKLEGTSSGSGGAFAQYEKSVIEIVEATIKGNYAESTGGGVYYSSSKNCTLKGCTIDGCHANYGGAFCTGTGTLGNAYLHGCTIENCYAMGGGAFLLRGSGTVSCSTYNGEGTIFHNNYADDGKFEVGKNYAKGGAIKMESDTQINLFRTMFVGNFAECGGAIYADNNQSSGTKYPNLFIDECTFDANYITNSWGPVISLDGYEYFIMNNCSVRGSYTTNTAADYQKDLRPSWICIDGVKMDGETPCGVTSISSCSILGNVQYSADGQSFTPLTENTSLVALWGKQTNYFTNNLILADSHDIDAIRGEGSETIDAVYNYLTMVNAVTFAPGDVGNVIGYNTRSDLDGLTWVESETNGEATTRGFWKWNGLINGSAPSMILGTDAKTRLTLCADFDSWLGGDREMDQRRVARVGDYWWPGAYQAND